MRHLLGVLSFLWWAPTVSAQEPVPAHEWDDQTSLSLSRCLVGEAGWTARVEHAAIAWVLVKRWRQRVSPRPFRWVVEQYCAALSTPEPTPRQRWVRALPEGALLEDPGFADDPGSRNSDYRNFSVRWLGVQELAEAFGRGEVSDPLPRATHWGSRDDMRALSHERQARIRVLSSTVVEPESGIRTILKNVFYTLRRRGPEDGSGTAPDGAV